MMSLNRIQTLLVSEYKELEDMVLVESPFAETTKSGTGIRQVHIGLTPTKLVIAMDIIPDASLCDVMVSKDIDARTETLELISVYGVECVNLSVYHRKKRQTLKARYCNGCVTYYELGGFNLRKIYWNLWCERIHFLNPNGDVTRSCSETSAASSTSCSTQYVLGKNQGAGEGIQVWCKHGIGDILAEDKREKWNDKDLYLGNVLEQVSPNLYRPKVIEKTNAPELKLLFEKPKRPRNKRKFKLDVSTSCETATVISQESVCRFASGVNENCTSHLLLKTIDYLSSEKTDIAQLKSIPPPNLPPPTLSEVADIAVRLWEMSSAHSLARMRELPNGRHRRRYALTPHPHFLYGLGPWHVAYGERYSVQVKRAVSSINIRRIPVDPNLRLPLSRRQLTATVSCEALHLYRGQRIGNTPKLRVSNKPALLFWTPDYWYRPRPVKTAYKELHNHLRRVNSFQHIQRSKGRRSIFWRSRKTRKASIRKNENNYENRRIISKNSGYVSCCWGEPMQDVENAQMGLLAQLKTALRMNIPLTAWDFDSTTLAYQLTMADQELFLKIPSEEFSIIVWQQTSKNTPNIAALIAFSHRVSCLITTAITSQDNVKMRARLLARFIYTAQKCNQIHNFQSCYSVLAGLQSPPCFRLRETWSHLRCKHASMHILFEKLCKLYRDPRLPEFQRSFYRASKTAPYLPYIGHLLAQLLDRLPDVDNDYLSKPIMSKYENDLRTPGKNLTSASSAQTNSGTTTKSSDISSTTQEVLRRFLSAFKIWPTQSSSSCNLSERQIKVARKALARWKQYSRGYTDMDIINNYVRFFQPILEDNRVQKLEEVIKSFKIAQNAAAAYGLKIDQYAREFLFKARYREDRENFICSLSIE